MELEKIARNYMSIWNYNNQEKLDDFADKNLVVDYSHFPHPIIGINNYKNTLEETYSYFPDIAIELKEIIIAENEKKVTVLWKYKGTHKKGEIFGIKASNKKVEVNGITILNIENNKVKLEKGIVDNMSLLEQVKG